jgi:hypothetical protein
MAVSWEVCEEQPAKSAANTSRSKPRMGFLSEFMSGE